jgi:hypothetical protein
MHRLTSLLQHVVHLHLPFQLSELSFHDLGQGFVSKVSRAPVVFDSDDRALGATIPQFVVVLVATIVGDDPVVLLQSPPGYHGVNAGCFDFSYNACENILILKSVHTFICQT